MYNPRRTEPLLDHPDPDGLKLYGISADGQPVDPRRYRAPLASIKAKFGLGSDTAGFAIFHEGAALSYLVVAWWGNDNELFTSVSVREGEAWLEDTRRYSFCLWDLEVIWHERNSFVRHLYSGSPDLPAYRRDLRPASP